MGTTNILRLADEGISSSSVGKMSVLVNGGGNGYLDRQQYAAVLSRYRGDSFETDSSTTLSLARQKIVSRDHRIMWEDGEQMSVFVDFTPQRED